MDDVVELLLVGVLGGLPGGETREHDDDDALFFVLGGVTLAVGFAFAQWQSYQDDADDDFFDTYDSRRTDRELTNRNRDDGGRL